jgi:hypothetical protein
VEDVHDHLEVIDHDPLTGWKTVDGGGTKAMVFAQSRFDLARNRFQMRLRSPGANDEEIRERGDFPQIEHHDLFRFLVGSKLGAGFR